MSDKGVIQLAYKNRWLIVLAAAVYLLQKFVKGERNARKTMLKLLQTRDKESAATRKEMLALVAQAMKRISSGPVPTTAPASQPVIVRTASADTLVTIETAHRFFASTMQADTDDGKKAAASCIAVANWIAELNPAFAEYRERFIKAGVNAAVLFSLDEKGLEEELGITSHLHRTTILKYRSKANFYGKRSEMELPRYDTTHNEPLNVRVLANKQGMEDVDWEGKRVLMRVDYNVPLNPEGKITDTARIDATIPSLRYILAKSAELKAEGKQGIKSVTLICHMGRPPTGLSFNRKRFSLEPCKAVLDAHLGVSVEFLNDCVGEEVEKRVLGTDDGTIFLCENLRFHMEETGKAVTESGDTKERATKEQIATFAAQLSRLGDVFVFEAFGAAHRPHASVVGITCPQRVAGLLMKKELDVYSSVLGSPQRPFLGILGGAKVSDKIHVLLNLLDVVDELIIGGGMAYTFKKVLHGVPIGASMFQEDAVDLVKQVFQKASRQNVRLHLPTDHIIGDRFSPDCKVGFAMDNPGIPDGWLGFDVGPNTRSTNAKAIARAKTILWNGPLGVCEWGHFAAGTASCMYHMVEATQAGCVSIIGGGDTGAASNNYYYGADFVSKQLTHVSTGGGSSLVLMEGKMLPAVTSLSDRTSLASPALRPNTKTNDAPAAASSDVVS